MYSDLILIPLSVSSAEIQGERDKLDYLRLSFKRGTATSRCWRPLWGRPDLLLAGVASWIPCCSNERRALLAEPLTRPNLILLPGHGGCGLYLRLGTHGTDGLWWAEVMAVGCNRGAVPRVSLEKDLRVLSWLQASLSLLFHPRTGSLCLTSFCLLF